MKSKIKTINSKQGDSIVITKDTLIENGYDEEYEELSKENKVEELESLKKRIMFRIGVLHTVTNSNIDINEDELNEYYQKYLYEPESSYLPEELKEFKIDAKYELCTELVFEYFINLFKVSVADNEIKSLQEDRYNKLLDLTGDKDYAQTIYNDENKILFKRLVLMDKVADKITSYFNFK